MTDAAAIDVAALEHIQATGRDATGRKQHRCHPDWTEARSDAKFAILEASR